MHCHRLHSRKRMRRRRQGYKGKEHVKPNLETVRGRRKKRGYVLREEVGALAGRAPPPAPAPAPAPVRPPPATLAAPVRRSHEGRAVSETSKHTRQARTCIERDYRVFHSARPLHRTLSAPHTIFGVTRVRVHSSACPRLLPRRGGRWARWA
jgi:hypothetical protein